MGGAQKFLLCKLREIRGLRVERAYFCSDQVQGASGTAYTLLGHVNSGQNGTVFRCADQTKTQYAVKFLHVLDAQRIERFDFECLVLQELDHINVLKVLDVGEVQTTLPNPIPFMITELLDGNMAEELNLKGPLAPDRVKAVALEMCDGFSYVHAQGVIHRDVKPGNFLLRKNQVVIGDFGLAKTHTDEGRTRYYRNDLTLQNEQIGPQAFMSPELIRYARDKTHPVDHRSDIFQIGAVLWYLLTGFPPCGFMDPRDDPSKGRFFDLLQKCMRSQPGDRFQTAAELRTAVAAV